MDLKTAQKVANKIKRVSKDRIGTHVFCTNSEMVKKFSEANVHSNYMVIMKVTPPGFTHEESIGINTPEQLIAFLHAVSIISEVETERKMEKQLEEEASKVTVTQEKFIDEMNDEEKRETFGIDEIETL